MQFQTDVHEALSLEPREREKLVKLHEVGLSLDLDLSEMGDLEQAVEQTKWIKDVCLLCIYPHLPPPCPVRVAGSAPHIYLMLKI